MIERLARQCAEDGRIDAVWLHGSIGRGEDDALSDIDVAVVAAPDCSAQVVADRFAVASKPADVALALDSPHNAHRDGGQVNALYDVMPLPMFVDWSFWPSMAERPFDVKVIFESWPSSLHGTGTVMR